MDVILVRNGLVENVISADSVERALTFYPLYIAMERTPDLSFVGPGFLYDGKDFTAPPQPEPPAQTDRRVTKFRFQLRFTDAEAVAIKDPPKAAKDAARAVGDLSDGARVTLAALLDGMSPRTAAVVADQIESVLAARASEATPRAKKEAEAARQWIAEVQAVLDEQARIQAEDDDVLMLLLAA